MTFEHNDAILKPNIPISEKVIQLINELHVLCRQKECNFTIDYTETANEWWISLEEPCVKSDATRGYSLFELALEAAIELLVNWNKE